MKFKSLCGAALAALSMFALAPSAQAAGKPVIAGIVFQQDIYMKTVLAGMRAGAKAGGATLLEANSNNKIEKEAEIIDTFIARGVNAIVITALHPTNSLPALERARAKGIVVVTVGSGVDKPGVAQAFFRSSDKDIGLSTGTAAAAFVKSKLDGHAKLAILAFKSLLPTQSGDRVGGFLENAKKGTTLDIVAEQDAWLPEKAVAVAGDILTAHPDVQLIYAANEGGTVGAMQAVKNAGKQGKVFVFGTDGSEQLARGLLASDNVLQATTAQQPFVVGEKGVEAALALLEGKPVPAETLVPVQLLSRGDKAGVEKFMLQMKQLNK
ncbi:MAG: substrate-binding domain-containing protein [Burkholderiales bacterium]|nr:substrate-binding domain-containing protein [Burkholderiales bacterium]MDE2396919.1 substrate-binding domain-containing protein [Burkholderiales bacterium]MDE2455087.1 substrate-binding domain-containing protein [Burkholderiales bacterium]